MLHERVRGWLCCAHSWVTWAETLLKEFTRRQTGRAMVTTARAEVSGLGSEGAARAEREREKRKGSVESKHCHGFGDPDLTQGRPVERSWGAQ